MYHPLQKQNHSKIGLFNIYCQYLFFIENLLSTITKIYIVISHVLLQISCNKPVIYSHIVINNIDHEPANHNKYLIKLSDL